MRAAGITLVCLCIVGVVVWVRATGAPPTPLEPELVVQTGHTSTINAIAFSPDGGLLASGSHDSTIKLWDLKTGLQLRTLSGHSSVVTSVVFTMDGASLISGSLDGTIRLWNVATGEAIRVLRQEASITAVAIDRRGTRLASAAWDHTVTMWDPANGRQLRVLRGHEEGVNTVAFSPDGALLASGGDDNSIALWNPESGTQIRTWKLPASDFQFTDVDTNQPLDRPIRGRPAGLAGVVANAVNAVTFSPDGKTLASVSMSMRHGDLNGIDFVTKLWDVSTGRELRTLDTFAGGGIGTQYILSEMDHNALTGAVSFSPDGRTIVGRSADYTFKIWDASTGRTLHTFNPMSFGQNPETARKLREYYERISWSFNPHLPVFSPDGRVFAFILESNIFLWDIAASKPIRAFTPLARPIESIAFDPGGTMLLSASSAQATRLWDLTLRTSPQPLERPAFPPGAFAAAVDPTGDLLATATTDRSGEKASIDIWQRSTGTRLRTFSDRTAGNFTLAFMPDGKSLAVGRFGDAVSLLDIGTGAIIRKFATTSFLSNDVALTRDGRTLAHAQAGGQQQIVSSTTGKPPQIDELRDFASGDSSSAIELFDVASGRLTHRIVEKGRSFHGLAFSPDGRTLAAGSTTDYVSLWDVGNGTLIRKLAGAGIAYAVAFNPAGTMIAAGGGDGVVGLWDAATGSRLASLGGHVGAVTAIAFSPDGTRLASGSADGTIRLWDVAARTEIVALVPIDQTNYVTATPDNYYTVSKVGTKGVAFRLGRRAYPFEQFDLRLNRPDIVLRRLGASPTLAKAYEQAWLRRLARMHFKPETLEGDFQLPEIAIVTPNVPTSTTNRTLKFRVHASDRQYTLDRLNLLVNDVPVYGMAGIDVKARHVQVLDEDLELKLSDRDNKIQVSVLNAAGVESLKETFRVSYTGVTAPTRVFLVAVGVSHYRDDKQNLTYAHKDANDLIGFWTDQGKQGKPETVQTLPLIDADATKEKIVEAKSFLAKAGVDDVVILFIAGHGLLDAEGGYYFGTADIDFRHPSGRGLTYEAIEGVLDGIQARKKLLLIDTCHAGEVDKGEEFALAQALFANLQRSTGAEVIAAVSGADVARENSDWTNGAFTSALLKGLRGSADSNKDGTVTISELRNYVIKQVGVLTSGLQKPVTRVENLELDFPLVPLR
jgi:WD40 repeat protein